MMLAELRPFMTVVMLWFGPLVAITLLVCDRVLLLAKEG